MSPGQTLEQRVEVMLKALATLRREFFHVKEGHDSPLNFCRRQSRLQEHVRYLVNDAIEEADDLLASLQKLREQP